MLILCRKEEPWKEVIQSLPIQQGKDHCARGYKAVLIFFLLYLSLLLKAVQLH